MHRPITVSPRFLPLVAVLAAFPVAGPTHAQGVSPGTRGETYAPELFAPFRWRGIGPNVGGRTIAVAGSAKRPLEYYFGAVGGGLWKTTNGGTDWFPVTDGQINAASVGAVAVCEANPDVVYIGTGEAQFRGTMSMGDGVYASRDAAKSWTYLGLESSTGQQAIARVRVDAGDCNRVYVAALGDPWGPNPERGIYRSTDGGRAWRKVLYRDDKSGGVDISIDPYDPRTIYAALWQVRRRPWEANSGGPGSGIFKTTDGGDTWTELTANPGLPRGRVGKIGISASPAQRNLVYALIEHEDGGLYRSEDAGATWTRMNGNRILYSRAEYYTRLNADPQEPNTVYILGNNGFFRTRDGGRTHHQIDVPHGDNQDLWIDPTNNRRMIQSNDGGANVSWDAGATWTEQDYPTAQMYHVITTNDFPYYVCGAQQDNSSKCVPMDGDGSYYYTTAGGEQGYIAVHPENTDLNFGGAQRGYIWVLDRKTGQRRKIDVWPDFPLGLPPQAIRERFQWTFPIIMSPHDPEVIYIASQHVWRTTNRGQSWERVSPDLTHADPTTLEGEKSIVPNQNSQDYYATVFSLAVSPHDANVIWAGSDDGLIHVTRDGGANWQNVTPPDLPKFSRVSLIEVSPHAPGKAYLAIERYKMQDLAPYLYRTEDFGKSWTKIVNGIPHGHYTRAVKEDTKRPGLLFAGTEHGPYISFDDGANWQPLRLNLADVQVSDLEVKENDLVISTYGRGFQVLDGALALLRQLNPEVMAHRLHLFKPADAVRSLATTTEEYGRTRRLTQALIEYRLGAPAERMTLEILDAQGNVIRIFTGVRGERPPERVMDDVGNWINGPDAGFAPPPPPLRTEAGVHRFVWDMRYPPAPGFEGMYLSETNLLGPYAPPGDYRVRLTADGSSQEQGFRILAHPGLKDMTLADLRAQSELGLRIHRRLAEATAAVAEIRAMRKDVDDRIRQSGDQRIAAEGERLKARLSEIEEKIYQVRSSEPSGAHQYGVRLVMRLGHLVGYVFSADARPTRQVYEVFDVISGELQVQLDRLDAVKKSDLTRF
ncbi:MAG: glycosyl hydrolase [Gemmatimonadetes bacterium]|nr:glycosyl hydrolase [Gemmatimonadota bacterium]